MTRVLKGVVALAGLVAMVAGIPVFLVRIGGNPLPDQWPSLGELGNLLTSQDTGQLFLGFLLWVAWIAWAYFTLAVLAELASQLGRRHWRLPVLGGGQRITAGLVTAIIALFVAPSFATAASAAVDHSPAPTHTTTTASTQTHATQTPRPGQATGGPPAAHAQATPPQATTAAQSAPATAPAPSARPAQAKTTPYTVKSDDTLWGIAERTYGEGSKYRLIVAANPQITDIDDIDPGQIIQLPTAPMTQPASNPGGYTVKTGDTLSDIAQDELGDANAWPSIAKANQGKSQPDGGHLTDPDLIQPGWNLTLPGKDTPATTRHDPTHTKPTHPPKVEPGTVDPGKRVTPPKTVKPAEPTTPATPRPSARPTHEATTEPTEQPTAEPTTQPTADPTTQPSSQPTGDPTTEPTETATVPQATATPTTEPSPAETTPSTSSSQPPEVLQPGPIAGDGSQLIQSSAFPIRTAGGAGVLLAAGLVGFLTARKFLQLLQRRPGQAIPALPEEIRTTEAQLRTVADPFTADRLNVLLRALASALDDADRPLPELTTVHMSDTIVELRLRTPAPDAPPPFHAGIGNGSWFISINDVDQLLQSTEIVETMPAPWPTLVTLGHDQRNAHVLVDLEQAAALAITSPDPAYSRAILAAITIELATSTWADDLRVTVVGEMEELATALRTGRIRYVDGPTDLFLALERRAKRNRDHLAESGHTSLNEARLDPDSADALTPEVVLIATDLTPDEQHRLNELVTALPRVAVAAVTATGDPLSDWNLRLTDPDHAVLDPVGIQLRPQLVAGGMYANIIELLNSAARTDTEPADWWDHDLDRTEPVEPEQAAAVLPIATAPQPALADQQTEPAVEPSPVPVRQTADITHIHAPLDVPPFPPASPWLQILGPVEIHGATGSVEQKRSEVCRRMAVFLALHPNGTPGTTIDDTLVISSSTRLSVLSRLRAWLGETPDGDPYLPNAISKKYRLHPDVRTDWDHFNELTKAGLNASPIRNLIEAMKLIKGRPMASGTPQLYSWASYHADQISAKIRDTALLVAEHSIKTNDITQARWAITTAHTAGLQHDEFLARTELRVERAAGNTDGIRAVVDRLNQTVRDLDIDLDPETLELMTEIEQAQRRNHA